MTKFRINKIDAARRQIETAIRLHFADEDVFGIHTLACAGGQILTDICAAKKTPGFVAQQAMIRPGKEVEFRRAMKLAANFLKHADNDAEAILEVEDSLNDHIIMLAIMSYVDLVSEATPTMQVFHKWYALSNPGVLNEADREEFDRAGADDVRNWPRAEQIRFGRALLHRATLS